MDVTLSHIDQFEFDSSRSFFGIIYSVQISLLASPEIIYIYILSLASPISFLSVLF